MRKLLLAVTLGAGLAIGGGAAAFAHNAGPCGDAGEPGHSDFAQHHVVPLSQAGELGNDGHVPGTHHGYSLCQHTAP